MGEIRSHKPPASNLGILGSFEQLNHVTIFGFLERSDGSIKTEGWTGNEKIVVVYLLSCPTLRDTMEYSLPGSSVHGISQARILEWVAISFSRGSS